MLLQCNYITRNQVQYHRQQTVLQLHHKDNVQTSIILAMYLENLIHTIINNNFDF